MQIDFVGPPRFAGLFQLSIDALNAAGHAARWFRDPGRYPADTDLATLDVLVALRNERVTGALMDRAPRLRALISPVTGTEGFDERAASERTILVANGQIPENYVSMAEATVMLILAALYDLNGTQRVLAENLPRPEHLRARTLSGKTVGLIGFGQIAQSVAARLAPWQCELLAAVRTPRPLPAHVRAVSLDELLGASDVVVVLTGLTEETRGMLDAAKLSRMKPDVTFVNVARGGIVDQNALARLAAERPDMRIALDVFDPDPLEANSPLRRLPHAILTPHMVGHTRETHERLPIVLLESIERVLAGELPRYVRNPEIGAAWRARWAGRSA